MQGLAKAGLKLAVGSAAIHSLTCWRTPVGRSAKLVSSAELALTLNAQAVAQPGPRWNNIPIKGDSHDQARPGPRFGLCHARNRSGFRRSVLSRRPGIWPDQQLRLRGLSDFARRPGSDARLGRLSADRSVEGVMTSGSGRLVIRCVIAILTTAISIGTMDSAVAQSRIGQIGRDGLTNRHEAPSSETEPLLRLDM